MNNDYLDIKYKRSIIMITMTADNEKLIEIQKSKCRF